MKSYEARFLAAMLICSVGLAWTSRAAQDLEEDADTRFSAGRYKLSIHDPTLPDGENLATVTNGDSGPQPCDSIRCRTGQFTCLGQVFERRQAEHLQKALCRPVQ